MDFTGISIDGPAYPFVLALSVGAIAFFALLIGTKGLFADDGSVPAVVRRWSLPAIVSACVFVLVLIFSRISSKARDSTCRW